MVHSGDLVPVGTMLVTPGLGLVSMLLASVVQPRALLSCISVMFQATGKCVSKSEGLLTDL